MSLRPHVEDESCAAIASSVLPPSLPSAGTGGGKGRSASPPLRGEL